MHLCKKESIYNSVDPDESLHNAVSFVSSASALFATFSTFLVTMDNIKSYMIQNLFPFFNGYFKNL